MDGRRREADNPSRWQLKARAWGSESLMRVCVWQAITQESGIPLIDRERFMQIGEVLHVSFVPLSQKYTVCAHPSDPSHSCPPPRGVRLARRYHLDAPTCTFSPHIQISQLRLRCAAQCRDYGYAIVCVCGGGVCRGPRWAGISTGRSSSGM